MESVLIASKAMLKVCKDLFPEFHEEKAGAQDVERAIQEYKEVATDDESADERSLAIEPASVSISALDPIYPPLDTAFSGIQLSFLYIFFFLR